MLKHWFAAIHEQKSSPQLCYNLSNVLKRVCSLVDIIYRYVINRMTASRLPQWWPTRSIPKSKSVYWNLNLFRKTKTLNLFSTKQADIGVRATKFWGGRLMTSAKITRLTSLNFPSSLISAKITRILAQLDKNLPNFSRFKGFWGQLPPPLASYAYAGRFLWTRKGELVRIRGRLRINFKICSHDSVESNSPLINVSV